MKIGTIVSDLKKAGEDVKAFILKVAGEAPTVVADVVADEQKLAPIIEQFVPGSAAAIALGNTLLDKVAQAVEDAGAGLGAGGVTLTIEQSLVNDVKAVIAAAKAAAKAI